MEGIIVKNILLILIMFGLIAACRSDNPSEPNINSDDVALKEKLIGGWSFSGNYIYFYDDGTYVDSSFVNPLSWRDGGFDSSFICTEIKKGKSFLNRVTKGFYKIENGILKRRPYDFIIDCNPLGEPGCYLYFNSIIDIDNDTLKFTREHIWEQIGSNYGILGHWQQNYWAWSYHKDLPLTGAAQLITETATFYIDSTYFHQKLVGLPYEGRLTRRPFTYDPPIFNITDYHSKFKVSFKNNKMHWTGLNWSSKYYRIK